MRVLLVIWLLFVLLLMQGTGWLLLAMADQPIGWTAENRMLALVAATKLLRQLKELTGCSMSSSGTESRKSSFKQPQSLWNCAIAGSVPVGWIDWKITQPILSIYLDLTSGEEEWKSVLRRRNTSVHALLTRWLMFLVSHLHCAPSPRPNSGGTLNWPAIQADRQWWMGVALRAMNFGLISSINDLSFIPICRMP